MILAIKTDQQEATILLIDGDKIIASKSWQAHRELADVILKKIEEILKESDLEWSDIEGVIGYQGPGSFTGLRIGLTVANTLAESLKVPIVSANQKSWPLKAADRINSGDDDKIVMPEYGADANITKPRK